MMPLWIAALFGLAAFAVGIPSVLKARPAGRYLRRRLKVSSRKRRDQGVAWEARMALKRHWLYPAVRPFLGSFMNLFVALFMLGLLMGHLSPAGIAWLVAGVVGGWGLGLVATWAWLLKKPVERYCLQSAEEAARSLAMLSAKSTAMPLLDAAAAEALPRLRKAAVAGYLEIGSPECLDRLAKLTADGDSSVAVVAKFAHQELHRLIHEGMVLSVAPMEKLVERVQYCRDQLGRQSNYVKRVDYDQKLADAQKQVEQITRSQLHLRGAFPDVYCMDCLARAEQLEGEEWEWVRCRLCKDATALQYGVQEVVGEIGGVEESALEGGLLRVGLWNEAKRVARHAEVARIEVIGGHAIQYDWAVNAVIERMRNFGAQVPVVLRNDPVLSNNTLALIRSYDPTFQPNQQP